MTMHSYLRGTQACAPGPVGQIEFQVTGSPWRPCQGGTNPNFKEPGLGFSKTKGWGRPWGEQGLGRDQPTISLCWKYCWKLGPPRIKTFF